MSITEVTRMCAACGNVMDDSWTFCGSCGSHRTDPVQQDDPTVVMLPSWDRTAPAPAFVYQSVATGERRSARLVSYLGSRWRRIALGVVVAVALVVATMVHLGTRNDLADTRTALASTTATLRGTEETLRDTEADLREAQTQVRHLTGERDDLRTELEGVQGSLAAAEGRVDLQAGQIETLKSCLTGVTTALGYVAEYDYISAAAALEAVEVSCESAFALI